MRIWVVILLVILNSFEIGQACVSHESLVNAGTSFESDILFFKTDEHYVVQQHLAYHEGRPYFNFSLCMKEQHKVGFRLEDASQYDFVRHCQMLGQWTPVYTPEGEDLVNSIFAKAFEDSLGKFIEKLEKRAFLAPMVDSLKAILSDYNNLFLMAAGAAIVRQAYIIAPFANAFGGSRADSKSNMRMMRAGNLLMFLSVLGMTTNSYSRNKSAKVHRAKLQEVVTALERMEREMDALVNKERLNQDYPVEARIVDAIVEALAVALATVEVAHSNVCRPKKDSIDPMAGLKQEI